jgi:protein-S-isoprenylcysteine O-methyltransferase Ste14
MFIFVFMAVGWLVFAAGTAACGSWLRRNRSKESAEKSSRVVHLLYFAGLAFPGVLAIFYPGLDRLDELIGIPPLPGQSTTWLAGSVLVGVGLILALIATNALRVFGKGANAVVLTQQIVKVDLYSRTRNPMSLGYYLVCVGIGMLAGSTFVTLGALLVVIPTHVFFLKYFEELELELRFGEAYLDYERSTPFLIPRFR